MDDLLPPGYPSWLLATACLWLACLVVSLVIHEAGHAFVAAALRLEVGFHLSHVESNAESVRDQVLVAVGGPVSSALQGVVFALLHVALRETMPTTAMVALMVAALGASTTCGYMLTTPFMQGGDMGKIARLLDWPLMLRIFVCILGAVGLTLVAKLAAAAHLGLLPPEWRGMPAGSALALGAILPWLVAGPVLVWAISARLGLFSALYPVFAGSYLLIGWLDRPDWPKDLAEPGGRGAAPGLALAALLALLALALVMTLRQR